MPSSKQRREAERRRLQRQVSRRAQREARRRRLLMIGSVLGTLVVIAVVLIAVTMSGSDDKKTGAAGGTSKSPSAAASTPPTSTASSSVAPYPCTWTKTGQPAKPVTVPPTTTPPRTGKVDLLVQTTRGPMTFQLNRATAPCAVESFVSLAQQTYFNSTPCHRVTTSGIFVLQCGDPTGSGSGGPGYSFGDELSGKEKYNRGVLAMANAGPNTNGSQFFIVYKNSTLPPSYTVFGKVTSGLPIVDRVAAKGATGTTGDGKPKLAISLKTVSIVE